MTSRQGGFRWAIEDVDCVDVTLLSERRLTNIGNATAELILRVDARFDIVAVRMAP
jgi:hypothetical protein